MANRWLLKTEPSCYSFAQLQKERKAVWDDVRNPVALKNLHQIAKGDLCFIYHTGDEKAVVGIARAVGSAYPDPKKDDPRLVVIDLEPVKPLPRPVALKDIKANKKFAGWELVRLPRLSVMPVGADHWSEIERMAAKS
jgi:predicted RNA-binding protein with PUA-like domain